MPLTASQLADFRRDGYILVPGLFSSAEVGAALDEMEKIFYGKSFDDHLAALDSGGKADSVEPVPTVAVPHYGNTEHGRAQFPTGADALDRLIENDEYLDVFEQCLGAEASYCNAHLFLRSGPTDERHPEHPWQGYHIDHYTNCFLPPSRGVGAFDYVNCGVYLHDIEEDGAPMHVIPGSHHQVVELFPGLAAEGNLTSGSVEDIRKVPEFAAPVPTTAKAGSALFVSSYLVTPPSPSGTGASSAPSGPCRCAAPTTAAGRSSPTPGPVPSGSTSSRSGKAPRRGCAPCSDGRLRATRTTTATPWRISRCCSRVST